MSNVSVSGARQRTVMSNVSVSGARQRTVMSKKLGLTQLAYFSCRVCDAVKISERKNQTYSVTHQPPIVTLA